MKKIINLKRMGSYLLGAFVISFFITRTASAGFFQLQKDHTKDKRFVAKALESGMKEVQSGSLAAEKAVSYEVKEFGRKMEEEHRKANRELKELAQQRGYAVHDLDTTMISMHVKTMAELNAGDFDRKFMKQMVKDHEKVIKLFEKEAKHGADSDIRRWAENTLPVLREHLTHARAIYGRLTASRK